MANKEERTTSRDKSSTIKLCGWSMRLPHTNWEKPSHRCHVHSPPNSNETTAVITPYRLSGPLVMRPNTLCGVFSCGGNYGWPPLSWIVPDSRQCAMAAALTRAVNEGRKANFLVLANLLIYDNVDLVAYHYDKNLAFHGCLFDRSRRALLKRCGLNHTSGCERDALGTDREWYLVSRPRIAAFMLNPPTDKSE